MREGKRKRLEVRGWKVGSAKEFLGLTDDQAAYIDLKLRLATSLRERRRARRLNDRLDVQREAIATAARRIPPLRARAPATGVVNRARAAGRAGLTTCQF